MLLPRELDMIEAGKHMPLPVPKPNVAELVALNKQEQGKVDSVDEDWRRQVWTRKPAPRDCAIGSGIDCGRMSALARDTNHLAPGHTSNRGQSAESACVSAAAMTGKTGS